MKKYKEYRIVYDHKGYISEAGQNGWIPFKEIAEKILAAKQNVPWLRENKLYIQERKTESVPEWKKCRTLNGKTVINSDWFYCDALAAGDYVEDDIVDAFVNALPPICLQDMCCQPGGACSSITDGKGRERNTYRTFKRVDNDTWEYCGECFRGENIPTGRQAPYTG